MLDLADQVTILRDGHVVRTAAANSETVGSLVSSMLGRELTQTFPLKQPPLPSAPVRLSIRTERGVSIEVRAGEIVGLAGLVGAGRTETARAVFGADSPGSCAVSLDGCGLRIPSPRDAIRHGIAYLPESRKDLGLVMGGRPLRTSRFRTCVS